MMVRRIVRLRPGLRIEVDQGGQRAVVGSRFRVRLHGLSEQLRGKLALLVGPGLDLDEFVEGQGNFQPIDIASRMLLLKYLSSSGALRYGLIIDGTPFAEIEPLNHRFEWCIDWGDGTAQYRICPFAVLHQTSNDWLLEAPLYHVRARLLRAVCIDVVSRLSRPTSLKDLLSALPSEAPVIRHVFAFLATAGIIRECAKGMEPLEGSWPFWDLFFHYHTRFGFLPDPIGAKGARGLAKQDLRSSIQIKLRTASPPADPPLTKVLNGRRSQRRPGLCPITIDQLAAFLSLSTSNTASPRMGGLDVFSFYLAVRRCDGLPPGFYRYCPVEHVLEPVSVATEYLSQTFIQAGSALGASDCPPDIVVKLVVDIARASQAYERIAYRLALLNAGMIMQTMYLAATALCLATCAIGSGDSLDFARQVGIDQGQQDVIAELALSSSDGTTAP
jgi:SagB-type dehydrogenase family enzyme